MKRFVQWLGIIIIVGVAIILYELYKINNKRTHTTNINKYVKTLITTAIMFDSGYEQQYIIAQEAQQPTQIYNYQIKFDILIPHIPSNYLWKTSFNQYKTLMTFNNQFDISYSPANNELQLRFIIDAVNNIITIKHIPILVWNTIDITIKTRDVSILINNTLASVYKFPSIPPYLRFPISVKLGRINNNFLGYVKNLKFISFDKKN